jgi:ABC-type uncharacterized transport system substrate-binding protein
LVLQALTELPQTGRCAQQLVEFRRIRRGFLTQSSDGALHDTCHRSALGFRLSIEPGFVFRIKADNRAYHIGILAISLSENDITRLVDTSKLRHSGRAVEKIRASAHHNPAVRAAAGEPGDRMTTRRRFVFGATALPALAWMPFARAQSAKPAAKVMRVGLLLINPAVAVRGPNTTLLIEMLRELGWIEGRNISYEFSSADGDESRLPEAAAALVARRPDVICVNNGPLARAAFAATRTIPIVFHSVPDPVGAGLVKSLSQPAGNVTGVATFGGELGGRRMQILKEALPKVSRVGVLVTPSTTVANEQKFIEQAAGAGVRVFPASINTAADLQGAFATFANAKIEAMLITQSALHMRERKAILQLAARQRIPAIGFRSQQVEDGALMSYNSSLADHARRAAHLVDKVLKGAKPAEIPVEQPTKFELVVNLKTAKVLGITIPQSIILQASRVIE